MDNVHTEVQQEARSTSVLENALGYTAQCIVNEFGDVEYVQLL